MRIKILNSVWSITYDDIDILKDFFKYPCERWARAGNRRERHIYYLSMVGNTGYFFTGLIPLIEENFPRAEIRRPEKDESIYEISNSLGPFDLEEHQTSIIRTCLFKKRGVVQSPTASGKTIIAAGIIAALNARSLFLVRSKDLMYQTQEVFRSILSLNIGLVGDGKNAPDTVTVGMVPSLAKWDSEKLRDTFPVQSIIVDEAHHAQADTYIHILRSIQCPYRLGLSATPKERKDGLGGYFKVSGVLGPIIHKVRIQEVPSRLAQPILKMFTYQSESPVLQISLEALCPCKSGLLYKDCCMWRDCYNNGIVRNLSRNQKIMKAARAYARRGKSVLIVVKRIEHGENLQKLLGGVVFVQGSDSAETRSAVKSLLQGRGHIAIATNIFGEGVDMPRLDVLINAAGGLSKIAVIQQAGRVLRRVEGKEFGTIVDFWDDGYYLLKKHSLNRYRMYKEVLQALEV